MPCTVCTYFCVTTSHRNNDHISPVSKYTVCNCSCIIDCLHAAKDLSVLKHVMNKYINYCFPPTLHQNGSVSSCPMMDELLPLDNNTIHDITVEQYNHVNMTGQYISISKVSELLPLDNNTIHDMTIQSCQYDRSVYKYV